MKAQHTPGPWTWAERGYALRPMTQTTAMHTILEVEGGGRVDRDCSLSEVIAEGRANYRLIVAAPELLEALQSAEAFIAGFEGDELQEGVSELLAGIRTAIAKAVQP